MRRRLRSVLGVLLADARERWGQTLSTVLGVATGVAVIVAIRLSSQAALQRFGDTFDALAGRTTHQLTAVEPLAAARLVELLAEPGVVAAHPVVAATFVVPADDERPSPLAVRLVGIDPFLAGPFLELDAEALATAAGGRLFERLMLEPGLVAMARSTLVDLGKPDGGSLPLRGPLGTRVIEALPLDDERLAISDPPSLLADLATAQELLGLGERVLRFDLVLDDDGAGLHLLPGERLERPERRGERADSLTRAFRLNLLCLGFLAVLVGAFLAFNMAQFAVTRRRALLGKLRCLGCPMSVLRRALLIEAALLGILGGLVGLTGGRLLADVTVTEVARTMRTLYGPVGQVVPDLDLLTALGALVVGALATVGATWGPAASAARTPPIALAGHRPSEALLPLWVSAALGAVAALALLPEGSAVMLPAISVLTLLLAVATGLPHALAWLTRRSPPGMILGLAMSRLSATLGRTGAAAGALAMPLAMSLAIVVMVGSLRAEVTGWAAAILGADIYIRPLHLELAPDTARLGDELLAHLGARDDITSVDLLRTYEQPLEETSFMIAGARLTSIRERGSMRIVDGPDLATVMTRVDGGAGLVSEPLARRLGLAPGDSIELQTRNGPLAVTVAAVFQDFSLDRGYVLLDEARFLASFGDPGVRSASLMLPAGADPDRLRDSLAARFPDAEFRTVARLRDEVIEAFDATFALTWALVGISTGLALVGILTALLCLHLERKRELGVLRALGARLGTVGRLMLAEAGLLMSVAVAAAVPTGLALAWVLVAVVNTRSFGWSFPMTIEVGPFVGVLVLALVAGVAAGVLPWLLVARSRVADLLEVED